MKIKTATRSQNKVFFEKFDSTFQYKPSAIDDRTVISKATFNIWQMLKPTDARPIAKRTHIKIRPN